MARDPGPAALAAPAAAASCPPPTGPIIAGRWREAADLHGRRRGAPYEQAIALSEGDEAAQRGADHLRPDGRAGRAQLRRRLRAEGVRSVPSGPAPRGAKTRPLTPRQQEVLRLLGRRPANADIAERLGLSAKTVEHHVSAVLAALDAPSRLAAVQTPGARPSPAT